MDINDILGTTYSAVKHNSDLLYMEEDFEREHRTDQLRAIKSIAESAEDLGKVNLLIEKERWDEAIKYVDAISIDISRQLDKLLSQL